MSLNQARKSAAADTSDEEKVAMAQPASRNPTDPREIQDVLKKSYAAQRSARIDTGLEEAKMKIEADARLEEAKMKIEADARLEEKKMDHEFQALKMKMKIKAEQNARN